jgi:hypothetical protein
MTACNHRWIYETTDFGGRYMRCELCQFIAEPQPLKARIRATLGPDPDDPTPEQVTRPRDAIFDSGGTVQVFFTSEKTMTREQMIEHAVRYSLQADYLMDLRLQHVSTILSGKVTGYPSFRNWLRMLPVPLRKGHIDGIQERFRHIERTQLQWTEPKDPVFFDTNGNWSFWDRTGTAASRSYATQREARSAYEQYLKDIGIQDAWDNMPGGMGNPIGR